ncbi:cytochrome P450 [Hypoxylon trugodes]|uniref:cytochrome P450 n=1 Tax=Hypoxylon trugodes TaxID=326681 RepID=UPI0021A1460E|nr:cytochrome P450 [Hypoxylon trugodes]KAI1390139.1 cytochrome P450 [Hypoxylon trugodes]
MAASLGLLLVASILLVCTRLLLNWRRLSKAPGPTLAGCTDLWRAYQQCNGRLREKLLELHSQYGPIVRYGVRSISVSDPETISTLYGSRAFITADSYKVLAGIQNGKEVTSLLGTRDEARHNVMRRSVSSAFTPTASLDYEKWIDATVEDLFSIVSKKSTVFDLSSIILWYTMDAASRFSFGEPLGCLQAEGDTDGTIQLVRERVAYWGRWSSLPQLERLIHRNPVAMSQGRAPSNMAGRALAKLKARVAQSKTEYEHPDLLAKFLQASKDHPQLDTTGVIGMLMSMITAAGDTIATTVTAILYYLVVNPESLKKLEEELLQAELPEIPQFAQTSKLPYLNATIKEGMRLFPVMNWPLERSVPAGGATIAGMYFPKGTSVGCSPLAIHHNAEIFGGDVHTYRPERWLISDPERLRRMDATHMGFSRGRRDCIGRHIAVLQMKKVIPAIIMKFKLSLVDPEASLEADFSPGLVHMKSLYVVSESKH